MGIKDIFKKISGASGESAKKNTASISHSSKTVSNKDKRRHKIIKHENPIDYSRTHDKPKHIIAVDEYYSMAVEGLTIANDSIEVLKVVEAFRFETQKGSGNEKSGGVAGVDYRNATTLDILYRNKTVARFEEDPKIVAAFEDADKNFETWDNVSQLTLKSVVTAYRESKTQQHSERKGGRNIAELIKTYGRDYLSAEDVKYLDAQIKSLEKAKSTSGGVEGMSTNDATQVNPQYTKHYDNMDGREFEKFCADLLQKNGFTKVETTSGSGDYGVDVFAEKDGITYAVQCKCYSSSIGNKAVQEIFSGKNFYKCHIGVVLTNQYFTSAAKKTAEHTGIVLWDRDYLDNLIGTNKKEASFSNMMSTATHIHDIAERRDISAVKSLLNTPIQEITNSENILNTLDRNVAGWEFVLVSDLCLAGIKALLPLKKYYERNTPMNTNIQYLGLERILGFVAQENERIDYNC